MNRIRERSTRDRAEERSYGPRRFVIVSQAIVDASARAPVEFREVGPVELKGVSGAMSLFGAHRLD